MYRGGPEAFNTEANSYQGTDEYLRIPARQGGEENNPQWLACRRHNRRYEKRSRDGMFLIPGPF